MKWRQRSVSEAINEIINYQQSAVWKASDEENCNVCQPTMKYCIMAKMKNNAYEEAQW